MWDAFREALGRPNEIFLRTPLSPPKSSRLRLICSAHSINIYRKINRRRLEFNRALATFNKPQSARGADQASEELAQMIQSADLTAPSAPKFRGRRIKFTPERIQQIKNLVEQGKSREEIAEMIGVSLGSLQVTCSRLGLVCGGVF